MNTFIKPPESYSLLTDTQVLQRAEEILKNRWIEKPEFTSSKSAEAFLRLKLSYKEREVFAVIFMDAQHRLLDYQEMFLGTIDGAAVYPREVVKAALKINAAAVIFSHNHPSGHPEPSQSDKQITKMLVDALTLIDVRVLDHVIVGDGKCVSFAGRGLL